MGASEKREELVSFLFSFLKNEKGVVSFYFLKVKMSEDTRSARRYCNTGATSSRGDTQAYQAQDRGLNKSLKLM